MKSATQELIYQGFLDFAPRVERSVRSLPYWYMAAADEAVEVVALPEPRVPTALRRYFAEYAESVGMPPTAGNRERMVRVVRKVARATRADAETIERAALMTAAARVPLTEPTLRDALLRLGVAA